MKIASKSEIKKAIYYSDLFSSDEVEAKKQFRQYCKLYHPDINNSKEAIELFTVVSTIYSKHTVSKSSGPVTNEVTFKDKSTGKGFVISNPIEIKTVIGKIYHTQTKIVIEYDKKYEKFYNNYLEQVKGFRYADKSMETEFSRILPKVEKTFETENGTYIILLNKTSEVLQLSKIVQAYRARGDKFPDRHAAWILNRLYNLACYLDYIDKVSNGISLEDIWVSPEMHTALLLGGWEYTVDKSSKMIGCTQDVYKILPIKVKDSKLSDTVVDLESIKMVGRELFKGHNDLTYIQDFLNTGSSEDVFKEWDSYSEAIKKQYGKREFVVWEDVPYGV